MSSLAVTSERDRSAGFARSFLRAGTLMLRWVLGACLTTMLAGALVVSGWTLRLVRWRTLGLEGRPGWVLGERKGTSARGIAAFLLGSLGANLSFGARAAFATWVVTAPAWALWIFSWYAGWNNSFHKGYEQAWVGPVTGLLGTGLFALAMLYVPMAQVRFAVTGRLRSFFDHRVVRALCRESWFACTWIACLYGLASIPILLHRGAVTFWGNAEWVGRLSNDDLEGLVWMYRALGGLFVFAAFCGLRLVAARTYRHALPKLVERGRLDAEALEDEERALVSDFIPSPPSPRPWFVRLAAWGGTRAGRAVCTIVALSVWLAVAFSVFVAQFLAYVPVVGWAVHPLVQLPWVTS